MGNRFYGEGNLGADPDLRVLENTQDEQCVCNMRIYFDRSIPNADGDGFDDKGGFWMDVEIWGKRAITTSDLLKKGNRVTVEGRLISKPWTDDNGVERPGFVIRANRVNPDVMIVESIKIKSAKQEVAA